MLDFDKKIDDIISDYYSTIGKFNNVSALISQKKYEFNELDDEETRKEKEGQQREILVDLGRIAEMAFKYIIKIRRMELYPNEPYLDSNINGNIVKGFRDKETLTAAVVKDLGNRVHSSKEDIESILKVSGIGPKAHDFNYLYLIINKLMPDIYDKLNEFMKIKIKSNNIKKFFEEEDMGYPIFVVFPNEVTKSKNERNQEEKEIKELLRKREITIAHSGDIFTRLRYYSNNPFDKNFNIDEIYDVVSNIITFIKTVHLYNEKIDFDPEIAFSYYTLKNNCNLSKFSTEEIFKIYSHNKIKTDRTHIMDSIFYSGKLSFDEVINILNCNDISKDDYTSIFTNSLNLEIIQYFRSIGIYEYEEMSYELRKKTSDAHKYFENIITDKRYSLEEYKTLRQSLNAEEHEQILTLLDHLSQESIEELKKHPKLLSFFINEFYKNVNRVSHQYSNDLFKALLSVDEVKENYNTWYGLDTDQLQIYWNISKLLLSDPLNDEFINKRNYYIDTIIDNIKDNIQFFKDDPKMLCVMPLMLDCDDNQHILNILIRNGLDIKDLRGFDSTIFCFPVKLVEIIEKLFILNEIPLIIDNKVNPFVMDIIAAIRENFKSNINIPKRRIPFSKSISNKNCNPNNNPIINELSYEEKNIQLNISPEVSEKFKQIAEKLKNMTHEEVIASIMRASRRTQDFIEQNVSINKKQ